MGPAGAARGAVPAPGGRADAGPGFSVGFRARPQASSFFGIYLSIYLSLLIDGVGHEPRPKAHLVRRDALHAQELEQVRCTVFSDTRGSARRVSFNHREKRGMRHGMQRKILHRRVPPRVRGLRHHVREARDRRGSRAGDTRQDAAGLGQGQEVAARGRLGAAGGRRRASGGQEADTRAGARERVPKKASAFFARNQAL